MEIKILVEGKTQRVIVEQTLNLSEEIVEKLIEQSKWKFNQVYLNYTIRTERYWGSTKIILKRSRWCEKVDCEKIKEETKAEVKGLIEWFKDWERKYSDFKQLMEFWEMERKIKEEEKLKQMGVEGILREAGIEVIE